jgi:hypothetical protein
LKYDLLGVYLYMSCCTHKKSQGSCSWLMHVTLSLALHWSVTTVMQLLPTVTVMGQTNPCSLEEPSLHTAIRIQKIKEWQSQQWPHACKCCICMHDLASSIRSAGWLSLARAARRRQLSRETVVRGHRMRARDTSVDQLYIVRRFAAVRMVDVW